MKFSYNWLQSCFDKKLPEPKELANLILLHFAEVEAIEKVGSDTVLDINVRPDRAADCLSHIGAAKEIGAILNIGASKNMIWKLKEDSKLQANKYVSVEVSNKEACPRYIARIVVGVKMGQSPKYIQERLISCGLRPINNVVDITNYVMLEVGQPLHAFDIEKVKGKKIIVRYAKRGEKIATLDNQTIQLDPSILVIADAQDPMAIAGIKGGKNSEIDNKTKDIIIESANFDLRSIRKTSRKINLRTDASTRFEHGLDPNLAEVAINRAAYLLQKEVGGKVVKGLVDVYPKKNLPKKIILNLNKVESLLGIKIPTTKIIRILKNLNFSSKKISKNSLQVLVPTKRVDVNIQENLIEDIGRIYGYSKIPTIAPLAQVVPPKENKNIYWENKAKGVLKELGFSEAYNYNFWSKNIAQEFGFRTDYLVEIANPLSAEQQYLKQWVFPGIINNTKENLKYFEKVRIFELGREYRKNKESVDERRALAVAITEKNNAKSTKSNGFYELKGILSVLFKELGVKNISYQEPPAKIPHILAEIQNGKDTIGFLGFRDGISFFEINFEKLQKLSTEEKEYKPISRHPEAIRDISISVPRNVKVGDILNKIYTIGGDLIKDVDLFDTYEGGNGKKSLAFHIVMQSEQKTLTPKELDNIQQKIIKELEISPDWEVRK